MYYFLFVKEKHEETVSLRPPVFKNLEQHGQENTNHVEPIHKKKKSRFEAFSKNDLINAQFDIPTPR